MRGLADGVLNLSVQKDAAGEAALPPHPHAHGGKRYRVLHLAAVHINDKGGGDAWLSTI